MMDFKALAQVGEHVSTAVERIERIDHNLQVLVLLQAQAVSELYAHRTGYRADIESVLAEAANNLRHLEELYKETGADD